MVDESRQRTNQPSVHRVTAHQVLKICRLLPLVFPEVMKSSDFYQGFLVTRDNLTNLAMDKGLFHGVNIYLGAIRVRLFDTQYLEAAGFDMNLL